MTVYMLAWTGGLEAPQFSVHPTYTAAHEAAEGALADAQGTDAIQIIEIDTSDRANPAILSVDDLL